MIKNRERIALTTVVFLASIATAQAQNLRLPSFSGQMPQTSKMKLAGGLAAYVKSECGTDVRYKLCEVFVQNDPKGSLQGYLKLYQMPDNSIVFDSDTLTSSGKECLIGGDFDGEKFDSSADFKKRSSFTYKRGTDVAVGMFYLERRGSRLKVNDERWNYCYPSRHIDDVWTLIGQATR